MELEELIVLFILKINSIFLLKNCETAAAAFETVTHIVIIVKKYYPTIFGRKKCLFNCFYSTAYFKTLTKTNDQAIRKIYNLKELTEFVACSHVRYYFYFHWMRLMTEIYDANNRELRIEEMDAFKKICLFIEDCDTYYNRVVLQVIHLRLCQNIEKHFYYDRMAIEIGNVQLVRVLDSNNVEEFDKKKLKLLKKFPEVARMRIFARKIKSCS